MSDERKTFEPHDRLTRISERLMNHLDRDPEFQPGDRMVVFLNDDKRSGIGVHGYEGETPDLDAMADLFVHIRAVFAVNGKELKIVPLGRG